MRRILGLSLALNLVAVAAVAYFGFGPGRTALLRRFLEPHQARLVSAFEAFPLVPDDIVFLGDSITEGGPWEELFPTCACATAASAATPRTACCAASSR